MKSLPQHLIGIGVTPNSTFNIPGDICRQCYSGYKEHGSLEYKRVDGSKGTTGVCLNCGSTQIVQTLIN